MLAIIRYQLILFLFDLEYSQQNFDFFSFYLSFSVIFYSLFSYFCYDFSILSQHVQYACQRTIAKAQKYSPLPQTINNKHTKGSFQKEVAKNVQFFLHEIYTQCIHSYTVQQRAYKPRIKIIPQIKPFDHNNLRNTFKNNWDRLQDDYLPVFVQSHVASLQLQLLYDVSIQQYLMLAQTLSLYLQGPLRKQTILQIFHEFAPLKVAVRDPALYVQITDLSKCADLIKKVKNGAFADLKSEIFEILDSPANTEALLEKCHVVFGVTVEVENYFKSNEHHAGQESPKKREDEVKYSSLQGIGFDEHVKLDLHDAFSEPSAKIEVQFDESPHQDVPTDQSASPIKEETNKQIIIQDFSSKSLPVVLGQQEETQANNNATDALEQKPETSQEICTKKDTRQPISEIPTSLPIKQTSVSVKAYGARSTCLTVVLVLWIAWLII